MLYSTRADFQAVNTLSQVRLDTEQLHCLGGNFYNFLNRYLALNVFHYLNSSVLSVITRHEVV